MAGADEPALASASYTLPAKAFFVHPEGSDGHAGTESSPFASIQFAIDAAAGSDTKAVVLRGATHFIKDTIMMDASHSNVTVMAYPGESPVVSGGVKLNVKWAAKGGGNNTYVADVTGQVSEVTGLLLNGKRATRARFPNIPGGIENSCGYGCMLASRSAKWVPPKQPATNVTYYTDSNPNTARNDTPSGWFQHYMVGRNGEAGLRRGRFVCVCARARVDIRRVCNVRPCAPPSVGRMTERGRVLR